MQLIIKNIKGFIFISLIVILQIQCSSEQGAETVNITGKEDTSQVNLITKIAEDSMQINFDFCKEYRTKGLEMARKLDYRSGEARLLRLSANISMREGKIEAADSLLDLAESIYEDLGDQVGVTGTNLVRVTLSWWTGSFTEGLELSRRCLKMAEETGNKRQEGLSYHFIGSLLEDLGNYEESLENYSKALKIREDLGLKAKAAATTHNMGIVHERKGDFMKALEMYEKALAVGKELDDVIRMSYALMNIGTIYRLQGDFSMCLKYYEDAIEMFQSIKDQRNIAGSYQNIAIVYYYEKEYELSRKYNELALEIFDKLEAKQNMASCYVSLGLILSDYDNKYEEALELMNKSLKISEEMGHTRSVANDHYNISHVYYAMGDYDKSIEILDKAVAINTELGDKEALAMNMSKRANMFKLKGDKLLEEGKINEAKSKVYPAAIESAQECLKLCEQTESNFYATSAHEELSDIYSILGDYEKAYENMSKFKALADSANKTETTKKLAQFEFKKQIEQQNLVQEKLAEESKALIAKRQSERNLMAAGALVFLLIGIGTVGRAVILKRKNGIIQQERDRSEELLLNILPAETAAELKAQGSSEARHYDQVTVLFADIKEFARVASNMSPAELVKEVGTCFAAFDAMLDKYGIEKIKTNGDEYMCAAGVPRLDPNHAEKMVSFALEMQRFMKEQRERRAETDGFKGFEIRIGIHSGPVVAGIVGVKKFAYDIWGNTVNLASRLEKACEPGRVNISEDTYQAIEGKFICDPRGKIDVKHIGEVPMYFVQA